MLTQPTIEKLCTMRLRGMAEAFQQQQEDANIHSLSFEERLGLLIDRQWNWRENRALERRLSGACATAGCKVRLASKTLITVQRVAWTGS